MKRHFLIFALLLLVAFSSCLKEEANSNEPTVEDFTNLVIPDDFDFKSTREVTLTLTVIDQMPSVFEIYNGNPDTGADLLKKGSNGEDYRYESLLTLPAELDEIYVVRYAYDGRVQVEAIPVSSSDLSFNFGSAGQKSTEMVGFMVMPGTWPNCSSSANFTVTNSYTGTMNVNANNTWKVEAGTSYTGELNFPSWGDSYLIICGTVTLTSHNNGKGTIIVESGGVLNIENNYMPSYGANFINYGTVNLSDGTNGKDLKLSGGIFENHGTFNAQELELVSYSEYYNGGDINLSGDFLVNSVTLSNVGSLTVGGVFNLIGSQTECENFDEITVSGNSLFHGSFYNYNGTVHFENDYELNGGAFFDNYCKLWVEGYCYIEGTFYNAGYIQCDDELEVNGGTDIEMSSGSKISTEDLDLNGDLVGSNYGYSKVEVNDYSDHHYGSSITGKIDYCDADGTIEVNNGSIGTDVTYCVNTVMSTDCVPGNGLGISDQDNDGIPDSMDEYPTDYDRAANSYYPNQTDYGTLAFEDLWPSMGDYDFNDLVINFQYQIVTDANNEIVDVIGRFKIKAAGAAFNNGFGFALDALPASVASVTGTQIVGSSVSIAQNGLESGHTNQAVVIVCDNINTYAGSGMFNTTLGGNFVDVSEITVTLTFNTPQASVGTEPFNPFIFIDQTRGREVHLINNAPTALANLSLFGTSEDASNPANGQYYKTIQNYPFAIETPTLLDYPTEKTDIVNVHLMFGDWAESGGSSYTDWYQQNGNYRGANNFISND